ncbi:murein biosynthesis integral membrane protein MurJ [Marinimicrobium sp. ABcell2]|uniref:murein biosynthesis integral membrane protein MurJ n=1 Tax=Marinimicrobium sp. ABcell2 TaxID=3069751 RepID=UPI0027B2B0D0|nr:murein biosynthesis integral membrane protein MurJ [Marinimicrobium sp. ABcell2]MDQ2078132.1 murein biosynthesis integral membrane protein MurJ [Marinimicrobium sp. ABcell2]
MSESAVPQPRRAHGLLRSSSVVGSMTMLSRVLGLVRDIIFARVLGAGSGADAFFVAFKIPNFMRRLFAEGAFAQAFVPVLSEYRHNGVHAAVQDLVDRVAGCLGSVLILITLLAVVGAPVVAAMFAPGFWFNSPEQFALTVDLIRITFPYLLLVSLTGFAGAILNSYDRFAIPAFTPVLLNISLISAAFMAAPLALTPAYVLAWGVIVAGVCQLLFQLPFLRQVHLLPSPKVDWRHPGVKKVLWLMAPAMFGVSVSQINLMLDTILASFLPTGSVSWLYYSDRLVELPNGVFAIALATVIMPSLSRLHAAESTEQFSRTIDWALRAILLLAVPAALALVVLAKPILFTLFQYGETTVRDMQMASYSLQAYALGLLGFMLIKILAPGYFARQDMKTPVRIGIIAMAANMGMNLILVAPLYYWFNIGHVGLALATALSAYLNVWLLYRGLRRAGVYRPQSGWRRLFLQYGVANAAMVAVLFLALSVWPDWAEPLWWQRGSRLAILCLGGLLVYAVILRVVGVKISHFRGMH